MKMLSLLLRNFKGDCLLQMPFAKVKAKGESIQVGKMTLRQEKKMMVCDLGLYLISDDFKKLNLNFG
jgi:hypothetical protein